MDKERKFKDEKSGDRFRVLSDVIQYSPATSKKLYCVQDPNKCGFANIDPYGLEEGYQRVRCRAVLQTFFGSRSVVEYPCLVFHRNLRPDNMKQIVEIPETITHT